MGDDEGAAEARTDARLDQIAAISDQAQKSWYAVLAATLFLAISVAATEPSDFFAGDRTFSLPVIGTEVPLRQFFFLAPILVAVIYSSFHLFQIRLWLNLGRVEARTYKGPLTRFVRPWQLTNAALILRACLRREDRENLALRAEPLAVVFAFFALVSAWGFTPVILAFAWYRTLVSRSDVLIPVSFLSLMAATGIGLATFAVMTRSMARETDGWPKLHGDAAWLTVVVAGLLVGWIGIAASFSMAARWSIDLAGIGRRNLPVGWLAEPFAQAEFRKHWCDREQVDPCPPDLPESAEAEWDARRKQELARIDPSLRVDGLDLAGTEFANGALVNGSFHATRFDNSGFDNAVLSASSFDGATSFRGAWMLETDLSRTRFSGVDMTGIVLIRPSLRRASIGYVDLRRSLIVGTYLGLLGEQQRDDNSRLKLLFSMRDGVDLSSGAIRDDFLPWPSPIRSFETGGDGGAFQSNFEGAALRFAELWLVLAPGPTARPELLFGDGSVGVWSESHRPCHWNGGILGDADFFGQWRGFLEATGKGTWPPSERIGNIEVPVRKTTRVNDMIFVDPNTTWVSVANIVPVPLNACSATKGIPCLEAEEPQFCVPGDRDQPCPKGIAVPDGAHREVSYRVCGNELR